METILQNEFARYVILIGITLLIYHLINRKGGEKKESKLLSGLKTGYIKVKSWFDLWPDAWAIPVALFGLYASYYVIQWIDPTAGKFDIGILQALLIGAVTIVVINALVFLGIEFNFPKLWNYYKEKVSEDFEKITPWQRLAVLFSVYFFLFFSIVLVFVSLL